MHFSHWLSSFSQEVFGGRGRQLRRGTRKRVRVRVTAT